MNFTELEENKKRIQNTKNPSTKNFKFKNPIGEEFLFELKNGIHWNMWEDEAVGIYFDNKDIENKTEMLSIANKLLKLHCNFDGPLYNHPCFGFMTEDEQDNYNWRRKYSKNYNNIYQYI